MKGHERTTLKNIKVSTSFILNLSNGKGNPSLQIMERIADALDKPLAGLLKKIHLDSKSLKTIAGSKPRGIAENCEHLSLILPSHQAFITRLKINEDMKKL